MNKNLSYIPIEKSNDKNDKLKKEEEKKFINDLINYQIIQDMKFISDLK